MTAFEADNSRWRVMALLAGAAGFVALGIWLLRLDDAPAGSTVAAWAAIVFFGSCFAVGVPRAIQTGPELRIDRNGIWWNRWSDRTIPWCEITRIAVRQMRDQRFLALHLRDPSAYTSERLLGKLASINRVMGFGDIALNMQGTDRSFDELADAVRRFAPPGLFA